MNNMNNVIRRAFAGVVFAVAIFTFSAAETRAQGVLKEVLDRLDNNYKTLNSLSSNITWVKTDTVLNDSDTRKGTVKFVPEKKGGKLLVRVDWTRPDENMVVIGNDYKLYRPDVKQVIQGTRSNLKGASKVGGALAFISMSKAQLQQNYTVQYEGQETLSGGGAAWHLLMTPKVKTSYKTAEIWVDKDGMPRQAKITENNNDTNTYLLTDIKKNININGSDFVLETKGAKVVNN